MSTKKDHYQILDVIKLIAAYMVIGLHIRPFLSVSATADSVYNYTIANYAVPFFYACTGFFLTKSNGKQESLQTNLKERFTKITRTYFLWTAIYFPLTVYGWKTRGKSVLFNVLEFVRNILFVGENYYSWTLWYLNGLMFALLLIYFGSKKYTNKQMLYISAILYIIGIGLQTLGGRLIGGEPQIIKYAIRAYFIVFYSTRNGLFQSFAFIMVGIMVGEQLQQGKLQINTSHKLLALLMYVIKLPLSVFEKGTMQHAVCQMLDLPTVYVLFTLIIIHSSKFNGIKNNTAVFVRALSGNIYYVHMYFVALCALVLMGEDAYHNFFSFFIVATFSTALGVCMIVAKKLNCKAHNKREITYRKQS